MLTFIDLFSGIGGFRLGMEMAGHKCLGHCEIDKFANISYMAMHKPKEGEWYESDITRVRASDIPGADVWCFGFPCQDISVAGKQKGFSGNRSSLFFTVTGLIRDIKEEDRPKYLFIENVKNPLSINRGFDFLKVLIELDEIGYNVEWQVLNSKDFGVPQNRERIFIIGHLRGRSGRKVFPITRESRSVNKESEKINIIGSIEKPNTKIKQKYVVYGDGLMGCLLATDYKTPKKIGVNQVGNILNTTRFGGNPQDGRVYSKEGISLTLLSCKTPKIVIPCLTPDRLNKRQNGRRFKEDGEPMFTLTSQDRHGVLIKEATQEGYAVAEIGDSINISFPNSKTRRGRVGKGVAQTLDTHCQQATLDTNLRIRKLTPRECFRLQGFPDEYFDRVKEVNSDSQLYKQAGNSVTVNVIYEIARRLEGEYE
jgi:DNA (cytosine-5)-methyltransferase 1